MTLHSCEGILFSISSLTAPSKVSGVTLTKTVASGTPALRVTWTPPQSDLAISHYQVEYRSSGTASQSSATPSSVVPPATSTILSGLDAGTDYSVRVRAVSEIGPGQWSAEQTEKTICSTLIIVVEDHCTVDNGQSAFERINT